MPNWVNPLDPAIVAFASVNGGTADNVIPEEVILTGTLRTLKPEIRRELAGLLEEAAWGVARISGGKCDLKVPGVHWQLGIADPEKGFSHPLHSPFFVFNEQVMPLGAAIHAQCAVDYLINKAHGPLAWPLDQF